MTQSIIFEKMNFFHFLSLKNDFGVEQCSSYYQSKALITYNSKDMHNFVIESIERFESENLISNLPEYFLVLEAPRAFKKAFFEMPTINFKSI